MRLQPCYTSFGSYQLTTTLALLEEVTAVQDILISAESPPFKGVVLGLASKTSKILRWHINSYHAWEFEYVHKERDKLSKSAEVLTVRLGRTSPGLDSRASHKEVLSLLVGKRMIVGVGADTACFQYVPISLTRKFMKVRENS